MTTVKKIERHGYESQGRLPAEMSNRRIAHHQAARIRTAAPISPGANAVINNQEVCRKFTRCERYLDKITEQYPEGRSIVNLTAR